MFPLRPFFAIIAQFEIFGVDIDKTALIFGHVFFGEDGLNRAFRLAGATVNALIGVDVEHGFAFAVDGMDAIDRANLNTGLVFYVDTGFSDIIGHEFLLI